MAGKLQTTEIDEKLELPFQLSRMELWEEKIGSNEDLVIIIGVQLNEFKLTIANTYDFYELIGDEDKKSISSLVDKKDEQKMEDQKINMIIEN